MRDFLNAAKLLLLDLASTIFFVVVFLLTHNTILAVGLGMALGLAQIGTQFVRRKPIDTMEWLSLFLVITAGTATLLSNDPRFVLFKPSLIYAIVGVVMLKPTIYGDTASVQAVMRVNAEQASKRTMRRPTRQRFRGRLIWLG